MPRTEQREAFQDLTRLGEAGLGTAWPGTARQGKGAYGAITKDNTKLEWLT